MKVVLLLALLTVCERGGGSSSVVGRTGQNVTLPCRYDIGHYGALWVCWNRGEIPSRGGCSRQLVSTDADSRVSSRYELLGRLDQGDASLTILNVTEDDAGRYGCRVDIPGLFNDDKRHFDLTVAAQTTTSSSSSSSPPSSSSSVTEPTAATQTAGHMTSTENLPTSSSDGVSSIEEGGGVTVVLVSVLFGSVVLLTAGGLFIIGRRWRRLNKLPQQQADRSVQFSSTLSSLQLHSRGSAVENIYQIDGGEYEYCP